MKVVSFNLKLIQACYVWDKKLLASEKWVGVVLRNLPPDCNTETLTKNLTKDANYKILSVEKPQLIKG